MATTLEESGLRFAFEGDAVKLDKEEGYYARFFRALPGGKGVDFIALSPERIQLIEVKNCLGSETDNQWRIGVDNSSRAKRPPGLGETDRDSLDIEMAKKAASSIACLYGAWSKAPGVDRAAELLPYWNAATSPKLPADKMTLQVILFLEGNFGSTTRPKKTLMRAIEDSIRKKLKWLHCTVSVTDSRECARNSTGFRVT